MIYNPFDAPLYIKSMKATTHWQGKYFGELDYDVGFTVPPKSTFRTPTMEMVSPAGLAFYGLLLEFMAKNNGLLGGKPVDVAFDIDSTIVAVVGGADGYLGNVKYTQKGAIITIQMGGKAPEGGLPGPGGPKPTTTAPAEQKPSATPVTLLPDTTTEPTKAALTTEKPTTIALDGPKETVAAFGDNGNWLSVFNKRQDGGLQPTLSDADLRSMGMPVDAAPEVVEAWAKMMINNVAQEQGLPPLFV